MPVNRFFIDIDLKNRKEILLEGIEYHHLAHVMKLGVGSELELVNGRGSLSLGKVRTIGKKNSTIEILKTTNTIASPLRMLLAIALMRPSKLEWIVEKGTEIGVNKFLFYPAQHSEKETLSSHQFERLHSLAISALKQSGRLYLPTFEILPSLQSVSTFEALLLFGDAYSKEPIPISLIHTTSSTLFISGPEKGFSPEELSWLDKHAKAVSLNTHTLRAETAPIVAASILGNAFFLLETDAKKLENR